MIVGNILEEIILIPLYYIKPVTPEIGISR